MRKLFWSLVVIILISAAASIASATEKTPPGSYLVYRATSVSQLREQLATNKLVQARYEKHFGMSPKQLDKYIADNLELVSLKSPLLVKTWYIDPYERIVARKKLLPTGTMVFATKDGEPVLTWSCGNPLRTDLPITTKVKSSTEQIDSPMPVQTKVLAAPVETITSAVVTAPPAPSVVGIAPVEAAPELSFVSAPAVSMPPLMSGLGALGALGALGGLVGFANGPHFNTPEPSGIAAIGMALSLLPMYRSRRRRYRA